MDVDRELAHIRTNARIQADRSARDAIARIDAKWPGATTPPTAEAPADIFEAWGQLARSFNDAMATIADHFQRGYTAIDRAKRENR